MGSMRSEYHRHSDKTCAAIPTCFLQRPPALRTDVEFPTVNLFLDTLFLLAAQITEDHAHTSSQGRLPWSFQDSRAAVKCMIRRRGIHEKHICRQPQLFRD